MRSLRPVLALAVLAALLAVCFSRRGELGDLPGLDGREPGVHGHHDDRRLQRRQGHDLFPDQHPEPSAATRRTSTSTSTSTRTTTPPRVLARPSRRRLRDPAVPRGGQPLQVGRHRLHAPLRRPAGDLAHLPVGERRQHSRSARPSSATRRDCGSSRSHRPSGIVFNETTGEPDFTNSVADFAPATSAGASSRTT